MSYRQICILCGAPATVQVSDSSTDWRCKACEETRRRARLIEHDPLVRELHATVDRLGTENVRLSRALVQIARMKTMPDNRMNLTTFRMALTIARTALPETRCAGGGKMLCQSCTLLREKDDSKAIWESFVPIDGKCAGLIPRKDSLREAQCGSV